MVKNRAATRVGGIDEDAVRDLVTHLRGLLDARADDAAGGGDAATVMVAPGTPDDEALARIVGVPEGVDVVITTSGSTSGVGHPVGLSLAALTASAHATHARLHGPGQWLTSLPIHHVSGFQVAMRSAISGIDPVVHAPGASLADEARLLHDGVPHYLSLVPTQLMRTLGTEPDALAAFDAILVGGAALSPSVAEAARRAGARIVTTYGMTETSGGCVYDGVPLDGVRARLVDGVVELAGPVLAEGYLDGSPTPLVDDAGQRWLRTADLGRWVADDDVPGGQRLEILGRADDVIISGGVNVAPRLVEDVLAAAFGGLWVVVGVPDPTWGEIVVAATATPPPLARVREATVHLEPAYRPRGVVALEIPHLPSGKVDRRGAEARVRELVGAGAGDVRR